MLATIMAQKPATRKAIRKEGHGNQFSAKPKNF